MSLSQSVTEERCLNVYLLLFTESLDRTCLNNASDFSRKKKKRDNVDNREHDDSDFHRISSE